MQKNAIAVDGPSPPHRSASFNYRHLGRNKGAQSRHAKQPSNETIRDLEEGDTLVPSNPSTMKKGHTRRASSITAFLSIFAFPGRRRRTDSAVSEKNAPVTVVSPTSISPVSPTSTSSTKHPHPTYPSTSPTKKNPVRSVSVPAQNSAVDDAERRPARRFPYLHPLLSRKRAESTETVLGPDSSRSKGKARALGHPETGQPALRTGPLNSGPSYPLAARPSRLAPQKIVSNLDMHVGQDYTTAPSSMEDQKAALDRFYAKQEKLSGIRRTPSMSKPLPSIPNSPPIPIHSLSGPRASFARSSTHLDAYGHPLPSSAATFGMPSTTSLALTTGPDDEARSYMAMRSVGDFRASGGMSDDEFIDATPEIEIYDFDPGVVSNGRMATSFASSHGSVYGLPPDTPSTYLAPSTAHGAASSNGSSSHSHSRESRNRKPSTTSISERVMRQPSLGSIAAASRGGSYNQGPSKGRMKKLSVVSLAGDYKPSLESSNTVSPSHQQPRRSAKSLSRPSLSAFGVTSQEDISLGKRSKSPAARREPSQPKLGSIAKSKSYAEFKSGSHHPPTVAAVPPLPLTRSKTENGKVKAETPSPNRPSAQSHALHSAPSNRQLQHQPIRRLPSISAVVNTQAPAVPATPFPQSNILYAQNHSIQQSNPIPEPSVSPGPPVLELSPPPPAQSKSSGRPSRTSSTPNSAVTAPAPWSASSGSIIQPSYSYSTTTAGRVPLPPVPPESISRSRPTSKRSLPTLPTTRSQPGRGR